MITRGKLCNCLSRLYSLTLCDYPSECTVEGPGYLAENTQKGQYLESKQFDLNKKGSRNWEKYLEVANNYCFEKI